MRSGRNRESRSREVRIWHPGYGTAGVGILPKQRPSKCTAEKGKCAEGSSWNQGEETAKTKAGHTGGWRKASLPQCIMVEC